MWGLPHPGVRAAGHLVVRGGAGRRTPAQPVGQQAETSHNDRLVELVELVEQENNP